MPSSKVHFNRHNHIANIPKTLCCSIFSVVIIIFPFLVHLFALYSLFKCFSLKQHVVCFSLFSSISFLSPLLEGYCLQVSLEREFGCNYTISSV